MIMTKHIKMAAFAALAGIIASTPVAAQKSAFQSSGGQTSLYLENGAAGTLNFGDTKFSVGGVRGVPIWDSTHQKIIRRFIYGFEVFGTASSGATSLFSSKIKVPEGGGDAVFGLHPLWHKRTDPVKDDWLLLDVGYSRSKFYTASSQEPIDSAKRYFNRYRLFAVYNDKLSNNVLVGAAFGAERRNNLDDLKQVTFQTVLMAGAEPSAASAVKNQSGYLGAYRQYVAAPLYTDILIVPNQTVLTSWKARLAIDLFTRSDLAASHRNADGGVGLFLVHGDAPTKAFGGIAASWNDGKIKVALVASYSF